MKVSFSEEALADAQRAIDWYVEQDAAKAAEALQAEIASAVKRIQVMPGLGTPSGDDRRALPVHRFPISLVYRVQGDTIRVIAVAHQRRAPGCWRGR